MLKNSHLLIIHVFHLLTFSGSPTDEQIDCAVRIVPVTALFAGRPELLDRAEEVIRQTQNNDLCVAIGLAAARFVKKRKLQCHANNNIKQIF